MPIIVPRQIFILTWEPNWQVETYNEVQVVCMHNKNKCENKWERKFVHTNYEHVVAQSRAGTLNIGAAYFRLFSAYLDEFAIPPIYRLSKP